MATGPGGAAAVCHTITWLVGPLLAAVATAAPLGSAPGFAAGFAAGFAGELGAAATAKLKAEACKSLAPDRNPLSANVSAVAVAVGAALEVGVSRGVGAEFGLSLVWGESGQFMCRENGPVLSAVLDGAGAGIAQLGAETVELLATGLGGGHGGAGSWLEEAGLGLIGSVAAVNWTGLAVGVRVSPGEELAAGLGALALGESGDDGLPGDLLRRLRAWLPSLTPWALVELRPVVLGGFARIATAAKRPSVCAAIGIDLPGPIDLGVNIEWVTGDEHGSGPGAGQDALTSALEVIAAGHGAGALSDSLVDAADAEITAVIAAALKGLEGGYTAEQLSVVVINATVAAVEHRAVAAGVSIGSKAAGTTTIDELVGTILEPGFGWSHGATDEAIGAATPTADDDWRAFEVTGGTAADTVRHEISAALAGLELEQLTVPVVKLESCSPDVVEMYCEGPGCADTLAVGEPCWQGLTCNKCAEPATVWIGTDNKYGVHCGPEPRRPLCGAAGSLCTRFGLVPCDQCCSGEHDVSWFVSRCK